MALSKTWVEGIITDSLGSATIIDSSPNPNYPGLNLLQGITPWNYIGGLDNGDNIFPVPTFARGVIISCDLLCSTVKTLKGAAGDTGIQIFSAGPGSMMLVFGYMLATSLIINSVGYDTGSTDILFF